MAETGQAATVSGAFGKATAKPYNMPNFEAVLSTFPFLSVLLVGGAMCRSFIYLIKIHENHHIKWADVEGIRAR
ncbi:hypothetical protein E0I77_21550 [Escherichia coli]|nr:hypothetical protein [Escherichia coli]TZD28511.1 hypothetical protein E0I77_21550 [Escherichia coli]